MAKAAALGFLTLASAGLLLALVAPLPDALSSWGFPALVMAFPVAVVAVAVSRNGRVGRIGLFLLVLLAMLEVGVLGAVWLTGSTANGPAGLPVSMHLLLWLVWLGPLFVTTLSYAATFDELRVDQELLDRLDRLRREHARGDEGA